MRGGHMHKLIEWANTKSLAFLSPYGVQFGMQNREIVNGITGVPYTFKEDEGAFYYCYHDMKQLPIEEQIKVFNKHDVWIYPVYPEYFDMLIKLKPHLKCKILGITDIQTHTLSYWPMEEVSKFIDALNCYDIIMATNLDETETFRGCLRDRKKIEYTGWCMYPDKIHGKYFKDSKDRDKNLVSVGISNPGDFNRDILTNLSVYNGLKKKFPDLHGFMYYVTPNKIMGLRKIIQQMGCKDFSLVTELPYDQAMDYLSKAYMAIHMYTFKVVGRLAQDCAALGVPMVGTIANLPNRLCFPEISTIDYDVDAGIKLGSDLIENPGFYEHCQKHCLEKSHKFYGLEETRNRMYDLLEVNGILS